MGTHEIDLDLVARMIRLVETYGLTELAIEDQGARYEVSGTGIALSGGPHGRVVDGAGVSGGDEPGAGLTSAPETANTVPVSAPMVGVFYRSPGPDQPPFVEVGDHVEAGQTIGLIEAMKVFSEVPAEHDGVVVAIVAENGQLVQTGQPLLRLSPVAERSHRQTREED